MNRTLPSLLAGTGLFICGCMSTPPVADNGLASTGLSLVGSASAQDSPSFRGPNGNGAYPNASIRTNWKEKAPKVWSKEVGYGFSEATVAGKKVVTAGYSTEAGKSFLFCFDADTGKELWKVEYADSSGGPRGSMSGPAATPVIDGDRVYMVAVMGVIYCMDLNTGAKVWEKVTNKDSGTMYGQFGDGASVLIAGDLAIAHLTTSSSSAAWLAFNKKDGAVVWTYPVTTRLGKEKVADRSYSPATLCKVNGKSCVLLISDAVIDCVELSKGAKVWSHSIADLALDYGPFAEPVFYAQDKFVLGTWYGNANLMAFQIGADGLTRTWKCKESIGKGGYSCVVNNGMVFGYGVQGLNCVDLADGKSKWDWRSSNPKLHKDQGEVILVGDKLVWVTTSGMLYVGSASPQKMEPLGEFKALKDCAKNLKKDRCQFNNISASPVFAGGRVYVRGSWGELACIDFK
jgi:outer membrane protein assembly factor BamB